MVLEAFGDELLKVAQSTGRRAYRRDTRQRAERFRSVVPSLSRKESTRWAKKKFPRTGAYDMKPLDPYSKDLTGGLIRQNTFSPVKTPALKPKAPGPKPKAPGSLKPRPPKDPAGGLIRKNTFSPVKTPRLSPDLAWDATQLE